MYHRLRVARVVAETADACSLVLTVPTELASLFAYRPGQYLTVLVPHDGGSVARCYSLSSSPHTDQDPRITIKRVRNGQASNWICDHLQAGDTVDVLPPAGEFVPGSLDDDLLLLAGGSGITPVIGIVKSVLAGGRGRLHLIYANRDAASIIFAGELAELQRLHGDRLTVTHWLDSEHGAPGPDALAALIVSASDAPASPVLSGTDAPAVPVAGTTVPVASAGVPVASAGVPAADALGAPVAGGRGLTPYICGPEPFVVIAREALMRTGVPPDRVRVERFAFEQVVAVDATLDVELDGRTHRLPWPAGKRMLDVVIEAGLNPPFSCRQGHCGACACRLLTGKVEMINNEILEEEDFAEGYVLACQSVARSENVSITYY